MQVGLLRGALPRLPRWPPRCRRARPPRRRSPRRPAHRLGAWPRSPTRRPGSCATAPPREAALGLDVELAVQQALLGTWAMTVLDNLYVTAEFVVLPLALVVLLRRARPAYVRLRRTLLTTWMLALPVFALLPTAPPRLAPTGLVDTVSLHGRVALDDRVTTQSYNP